MTEYQYAFQFFHACWNYNVPFSFTAWAVWHARIWTKFSPLHFLIMLRWFLECSTRTKKMMKKFEKRNHWHCCMCPQLFDRVNQFRMHLEVHGGKRFISLIPPFKDKKCTDPTYSGHEMPEQEAEQEEHEDTCTECGKQCWNEFALQHHFREVNKRKREGAQMASKLLAGVCIDFSQGIFLIKRTFSGVSQPIHCQHSTYAERSTACVTACSSINAGDRQ